MNSIPLRSQAEPLLPEVWASRFLERHGFAYDYKTDSLARAGSVVDSRFVLARMRLELNRARIDGIRPFLVDSLLLWRKDQEEQFLAELRAKIAYREVDPALDGKWVLAATGKESPLDAAVLRHFIWQAKRKLFGLSVEHHMMPVLYGKSGGGKSVAVHALIAPLSDVAIARDLTVFNDQFARRQFARNFVMFFDELGKSHQADVNSMKNIITAPKVEWRGINSESTQSASQNCTFIGCSNLPVRERIQDPTSVRRFWQINCADQLDWSVINSLDYIALWQSVDESGPCPILPYLEEIRAVQEQELRVKDPIESWLEFNCEPASFQKDSPTTDELYMDFAAWCCWQSIKSQAGLQIFARGLQEKLDRIGWIATSKRTNRGTTWSLKVKTIAPESKVIGLAARAQSEAVSEGTTEGEK